MRVEFKLVHIHRIVASNIFQPLHSIWWHEKEIVLFGIQYWASIVLFHCILLPLSSKVVRTEDIAQVVSCVENF
jgi:hypothetical protein